MEIKKRIGGRRKWKEETEKWVDITGTGEITRSILEKSKRKERKRFVY
jgi:hypothetical protein